MSKDVHFRRIKPSAAFGVNKPSGLPVYMDKKLITCSIFLDLRKAYDTINHTILIKKLEKYGIRGLPLQLLASYLTDRQQYTIVNQCKSKSRDVICGIPL